MARTAQPLTLAAAAGTEVALTNDEGVRVGGNGPSFIQASLGFTLSLVTLMGCVVGLGMAA